MYGFVYMTEFPDGTKYIGKAKGTPEDRKYYFGSAPYIDEKVEKFGRENVKKKIICICPDEEYLQSMERKYQIACDVLGNNVRNGGVFLNKTIYNYYFNTANNPGFQKTHTDESIEKIKKNNPMKRKEVVEKNQKTRKERKSSYIPTVVLFKDGTKKEFEKLRDVEDFFGYSYGSLSFIARGLESVHQKKRKKNKDLWDTVEDIYYKKLESHKSF